MELITKETKCPECGQLLTTVSIQRTTMYAREGNSDFHDTGQGAGSCLCGKCGKEIGGYGGGQSWGYWLEEE